METQLHLIRNKLINNALGGFAIFAIPAGIASALRFFQIGWHWIYLFHIVLLMFLGFVFAFRSKLSIELKTHFVSISFLLSCYGGALTFGISGGYFFCIFSVILTTLIFGKRMGYIYFLISTSGLSLISILHIFRIVDTKIDYNVYNYNITSWLTLLTGLFLLLVIFIYYIGLFYDFFTQNIQALTDKSREQEIIQSELKKSEEKYRHLINEVPVGIFQTSLSGKALTANISMAKMLGYTDPEELVVAIEDTARQVWFNPDERIEYVSLHEEYESIYDFKCQLKRKDNSIIWVSMNSHRVRDSEGKTAYFSGYIEDITERKLLKEQTKLLKDSIDVATDGAYWMDSNGKFVYVNFSGSNMLGYTNDEIMQMSVWDINPNISEQIWPEVWNLIKTNGTYTNKSVHKRKDGSTFPVEIVSTYIKFGNNEYINGYAHDITERKKAEEALKETEALYSTIFEHSPIGLQFYACDGLLLKINASCLDIFGIIDPEEIKNWNIFNDPNVTSELKEKLLQGESINYLVNFDFEIVKKLNLYSTTKSGIRIFEVQITALEIGFIAQIQDISERRMAELSLKASEARYRSLYENAPVGIFYSTIDGKINSVNEAYTKIMGYASPDEIKATVNNKSIGEIIYTQPDERFHLIEQVQAAPGKWLRTEQNFKKKDGTQIIANLIMRSLPENTYYLEGFVEDITLRRKNEKALKDHEERLQKLLNSVTDYTFAIRIENGVVTHTKHGEGCKTITGYSQQEFESDPNLWYNIIHENDKCIIEKQIQELFKSRVAAPVEHRIYHKNGNVKWVLNTSVSQLSPEGDLIGYDGLISDITVRKMLENQVLNTVIETEERERLHFSQELHDGLGPILSSIKMFVQLLSVPDKKMESKKILSQLEKLIDESTHTVREVSFKLNPHILQNYGLAEAIKSYTAKINESSKINFILNLKALCRFDEKVETIVYRVLCECITNTLKHAQAKKIKIDVLCDNNLLYIDYTDDGKGFDQDIILTSHNGIGLTNMQSRLKAINGSMDIYSIPEAGTTIKFQINLNEK